MNHFPLNLQYRSLGVSALVLLVLSFLLFGIRVASAGTVTLHSTFTWPREYDDALTYVVRVHSSPHAKSGIYQLSDTLGDIRGISVGDGGKIQDNIYYGGPATISPDDEMITFTFVKSYNVNATTGGYDPSYPSIPSLYAPGGPAVCDFILSLPPQTEPVDYAAESFLGEFSWNNLFILFEDLFFNTAPQYNPLSVDVYVDLYISPAHDQSCPTCAPGGGCSACSGGAGTSGGAAAAPNPKMAGYSFDFAKAGLIVSDTPVRYSPPLGPGVAFTTTYNQRDVGEVAGLPVSGMGPGWTFSWLSYVIGTPETNGGTVQRFAPGGGLEDYQSFQDSDSYYAGSGTVLTKFTAPTNATYQYFDNGTYYDGSTYHYAGSSQPERQSHAVLTWDPGNGRYIRVLPDGSYEIYGEAVTKSGATYYLLTQRADAQGNLITFRYDSRNRLVSVSDSLNQTTSLTYGLAGQPMLITAVTDPFGRAAHFHYDDQGRLVSSTDPLGITSFYGYDSTNFLNSLTTPYGQTTFSTDNDSQHEAVQATNPLGQTERTELRYSSVADIADSETNVPSAAGLIIDNSGLSSGNTYYWDRHQYTSPPIYANATIYHWMVGPHGLTNVASSWKKPLEGRVWATYQGQVYPDIVTDDDFNLPIVNARLLDNGTTQASFSSYASATGNLVQSVDALGRTTNYSYDPFGIDLLTVTQKNGSGQDTLSSMTYNSIHEPLTITDASGQTTNLSYNLNGQLETRTNAKQETTTYSYSSSHYLQSVTGPVSGATTSYSYDSVGRVQTVTDSEGYVITNTYDNLDRLTSISYPDGTSDQTLYDNPSTPLDAAHTIDRQGRRTYNRYDAIRELMQTTDPQARVVKYGWCTCGGLATLTDANGNVTTWYHDMQGRVTSKVYADNSQITYVYEASTSRLHSMTDAVGNVATYAYNADNTLASTTYAPAAGAADTPNVSFTYDTAYNRVLTMTDGTGQTVYSYNPVTGSTTTGAGRLASVSVPIAGSAATVAYGYDELGRVTSRSVDGATTNANNVSTTFDSLGRITNVTNALGAFTYTYVDTTSRLNSVTYPSGTGFSTSYAYFGNSGDQRLQEIKNMAGSNVLSKFDYTYNPVGTIATWTQQTDSKTPTQYVLGYDNADQLTSAVQSNTTTSSVLSNNGYGYDPAGNRLSETTLFGTKAGQFNALNQLKGYGAVTGTLTVSGNTSAPARSVSVNSVPATINQGTNFTAPVPMPAGTNTISVVAHPASGAPTTKRYQIVSTGTLPTQLAYDANGNITTDENGNSYQWDALNRLTKIAYPSGASSLFAYDGLSRRVQIEERNTFNVVTSTKNYLWVGSEVAEERDTSNAVEKRFFPQGEQQASADYYYTSDQIGSIREFVGSSGNVVSRLSYDVYGVTSVASGTTLPTKGYAGMYWHQPSNLYLTRNAAGLYGREYDTGTGRWLSRDAAAESGGLNLYQYCGNEPIDFDDPLGLKKCWKLMLITQFNDPLGTHDNTLGFGDAASGVPGYKPSDFDKNGKVLPGHVIHRKGVYPRGTQFTIYHQNGTVAPVTINDSGAGYAEPRPKSGVPGGTSPDDWLDEWHNPDNGDPEWDWVSQEVPDKCPCPKGWKG